MRGEHLLTWKTVVLGAMQTMEAWNRRLQRRKIRATGLEDIFVIFWQRIWWSSAHPKNLPEGKLKGTRLIKDKFPDSIILNLGHLVVIIHL